MNSTSIGKLVRNGIAGCCRFWWKLCLGWSKRAHGILSTTPNFDPQIFTQTLSDSCTFSYNQELNALRSQIFSTQELNALQGQATQEWNRWYDNAQLISSVGFTPPITMSAGDTLTIHYALKIINDGGREAKNYGEEDDA